MAHSISILDIAHEIRPLLPELLGEEAEAVDQALAWIFAKGIIPLIDLPVSRPEGILHSQGRSTGCLRVVSG